MHLTYQRAKSTKLAEAGLDERWLQERIQDDPTVLNLGDLYIVTREKKQSSGGRIDFLMADSETDTMYEVEVMLGTLDESHIIRTIEYWDIERRRYSTKEHCAVIVAEEITNRFFNVIALFNRAIPIIAIQLNAFTVDDKLVLNFTKVLDIYEQSAEEEEGGNEETTDRMWWIKRSSAASVQIVEDCAALISKDGKGPRLTYNKNHIAMGGTQKNFCWFHPRINHCHVHCRSEEGDTQELIRKLDEAGIEVSSRKKSSFKAILTLPKLKQNTALIAEVLSIASRYGGDILLVPHTTPSTV